MLSCTDRFLTWSALQVKHSKCAVFYERRSGGNRWYRSRADQHPSFTISDQPLRVYTRHETYNYLGHKFNIAGEWSLQVTDMAHQFMTRLDLIDASPLPITLKVQAIRDIAFSKIQHLFANVHIPQKVLREMDDKTVNVVRKWLCLNTHSTRCFIFQKRQVGGLGVPNCMWEYIATRQSHLTNMLNCDDVSVRQMARASLLLDFKRRKVLHACGEEDSFLGFKRKTNGKLDGRAQGFGVSSDWPDLNDLCWRTGTELKWTSHYQPVEVSDAVVEDPSVIVEARLHHNNIVHLLQPRTSRQTLLSIQRAQNMEYWSSIKLQGKLAKVPCADHSVSHIIYSNATISEEILTFCVQARLQVLPTKCNLSLWFPSTHSTLCLLHDPPQHLESVAHIMNSCSSFKGLYTARHDRLVDLIAAQIPCVADEQIFKHTTVQSEWFNSPANTFLGIANTPDIINISQNGKTVTLFEVSCAFDLFMEDSYCSKILKYQSLISTVENLGYKCQLIVLVFGSLGHVHRLAIRGLCIGGAI